MSDTCLYREQHGKTLWCRRRRWILDNPKPGTPFDWVEPPMIRDPVTGYKHYLQLEECTCIYSAEESERIISGVIRVLEIMAKL